MTHTNNYKLILAKLNIMKLKSSLVVFYAIRQGNGSGLFSSSQDLQGAHHISAQQLHENYVRDLP